MRGQFPRPITVINVCHVLSTFYSLLQTGETTKTGAPVEQFGEGREVFTSTHPFIPQSLC